MHQSVPGRCRIPGSTTLPFDPGHRSCWHSCSSHIDAEPISLSATPVPTWLFLTPENICTQHFYRDPLLPTRQAPSHYSILLSITLQHPCPLFSPSPPPQCRLSKSRCFAHFGRCLAPKIAQQNLTHKEIKAASLKLLCMAHNRTRNAPSSVTDHTTPAKDNSPSS